MTYLTLGRSTAKQWNRNDSASGVGQQTLANMIGSAAAARNSYAATTHKEESEGSGSGNATPTPTARVVLQSSYHRDNSGSPTRNIYQNDNNSQDSPKSVKNSAKKSLLFGENNTLQNPSSQKNSQKNSLRRNTSHHKGTRASSNCMSVMTNGSLMLGPYKLQSASPGLLEHCKNRAETVAIQICQSQNCSPEEIQRQIGLTQTGYAQMTSRVQDPNAVNELFSTYPILQMIYLQAPDIFSSWNPFLNKHANETWNAQLHRLVVPVQA